MSFSGKNMYAKAELPFQSFSHDEQGLVERLIREAWSQLKKHQNEAGIDLAISDEAHINILLVQTINAIIASHYSDNNSCYEGLFERISSSAEYKNYNGTSIKQPDMVFHLRAKAYPGIENDYQSYCVEAKKISNNSSTIHNYNETGIKRFLAGDYAWAMPTGMMIGYCQSGLKLPDPLINNLSKNRNKEKYQILKMPKRISPPNPSPSIYSTLHSRVWLYSDREGAPGDIEIRHLWLDCL